MWIDYAIYSTTGALLLSLVTLVVLLSTKRGTWVIRTVLFSVAVLALIGTNLVRPERSRETGEDLFVVEAGGRLEAEVELIGTCLSLFREIGPLSFVMANDNFSGEPWDRPPHDACELMGVMGTIHLPDMVRSGDWMLCDYATCHQLVLS